MPGHTNVASPTAILREDHEKVKELFARFEEAESASEKGRIAEQAIAELKAHTSLEEEIFYPEARDITGDEDLLNEAEEEHHVAKLLIKELEKMSPGDEHYEAKFTVLAESVKHHIEEEESELFPKLEDADADLEGLGRKMAERKESPAAGARSGSSKGRKGRSKAR
ncbi:MAG: hemerythrin domain-containing protein [Elusimicrobiota bacterium]